MLLRGVGGGFGVHSVGGFLASLYTSWVGSKDFIGFRYTKIMKIFYCNMDELFWGWYSTIIYRPVKNCYWKGGTAILESAL